MPWTIYILECRDKTLYTGITNDLEKRLAKHLDGSGAKYTRGRGPFTVLYTETRRAKGHALKRELKIKALSKLEKLQFIDKEIRSKALKSSKDLKL